MPEMDGIEAAKQIKSIDSNAKIVMVSSSDKKNTRNEAEKIGVSEYIRKPFDRLEIKRTIESLSRRIEFARKFERYQYVRIDHTRLSNLERKHHFIVK